MSNTRAGKSRVRPVLGYHNYILLTAGLDAEWTRKHHYDSESRGEEAFIRVFTEFDKISHQIRDSLKPGFEKITNKKVSDEAWRKKFGALYEPVHCLPVGHADALSFVLLDDFDSIHEITARCSTTIEEIGIGFCPHIRPIMAETPATLPNCFLEPHEMVAAWKTGQNHNPLVMFTRFKLNGWGSLSFGLLFRAALTRAIVSETQATLAYLKHQAINDTEGKLNAFEVNLEDIEASKFCLLDMQGQEELALWCITNNYTITMAVLSRIHSIVIGTVLSMDKTGQLEKCFQNSHWFSTILKSYRATRDRGLPTFRNVKDLYQTHVFRWTRTTLGVSLDGYKRPDNVRGYVHAVSVLQTATGHQHNVDEKLEALSKQVRPSDPDSLNLPKFRLHAMGQGDLLLHHNRFESRSPHLLLKTKTFFDQVRETMRAFVSITGERPYQRDLVGLSSVAGVPVPEFSTINGDDFLCPRVKKAHRTVLETILPALRMYIAPDQFYKTHKKYPNPLNFPDGTPQGALSLDALRSKPLLYGLPVSLIHSLEFLYQDFVTLLANPFVFDSVLDLYDAFATLHKMLTRILPGEGGIKGARQPRLHHTKVEELAKFVMTLHRALEHRLYRAYPEELHRDMDVDFRGGLNQLLYAADSTLKCGVGILRNILLHDCEDKRDTVGVVMRVAFEPGIWAINLELGPEMLPSQQSGFTQRSARLATITTDVPHIHHVPSFLDFLHESFHLIYDELRNPSQERTVDKESKPVDFLPMVIRGTVRDERLSEIFVNLLTTLFVCRDDPEMIVKHYFIQYSTSPWVGSANEPECMRYFVEFASAAFISCYLLRKCKHLLGRDWWAVHTPKSAEEIIMENLEDPEQVWPEFKQFLEGDADGVGRFFCDWEKYWGKSNPHAADCWDFMEGTFRDYFRCVRQGLPTLIGSVHEIFMKYTRFALRGAPGGVSWTTVERTLDDFIHEYEPGGKHGPYAYPLSVANWQMSLGVKELMLVVSQYLREAIKQRINVVKDRERTIHLDRLDEDGQPVFNAAGVYSMFLIHPGSNSFWCPCPRQRRARLARQIRALKTFWDVSIVLKTSRLGEMLERNVLVHRAQR